MAPSEPIKTNSEEVLELLLEPVAASSISDGRELRKRIDERVANEAEWQRNHLLRFLTRLTGWSFALVAAVTIFQAVIRIWKPDYTIFTGKEFEILSISVFGEAIGVIVVITRKLWDLMR